MAHWFLACCLIVATHALDAQTLAPSPQLVVGKEGDPHAEFGYVVGAVRLANGEIVGADNKAAALQLFDRTGQWVRTFGRRGQGPGEFEALEDVFASGDTLFASDFMNRRINVYLADGTVLESRRITSPRASIAGHLADGRWAVMTGFHPTIEGPQRVYPDSARVGWLRPSADGDPVWLPASVTAAMFVFNPSGATHGQMVGMVPFGPIGVIAVAGNRILTGASDVAVLTAFDTAGVAAHIPLPMQTEPLTGADVGAERDRQLASAHNDRERAYVDALLARSNLPRNRPTYDAIVPGPGDELWIVPPAAFAETHPFVVIDGRGRLIARIPVPAGFRLKQVGRDFVLGVHTDDLGIEQVQLYRLVR